MKREYRHELKYYISKAEYELLSRKLALTMNIDPNADQETGRYFIRSLYFDDYQDGSLNEKLEGSDLRDKYRLRIYNLKDAPIQLECKHKHGPYIQKSSVSLSRQEADALLKGNYSFLLSRGEPFAREAYAAFLLKHLSPRVLVDYWREAYVMRTEDVRVTFDMDVRTAFRSTRLFDGDIPTYPVVDEYGMIMEIKFNRYLPGYIHSLVQPFENAQRSAISKYCLCRKYE